MKGKEQKKIMKPGGYAELWLVAYPLIITNATNTVMQFIDRKFLSMNSTEDIAAALPGGILAFTLFTFFMVTTGFTAAVVSQFHGKGDREKCASVPWSGFYFALAAGLLCSYVLIYPGAWLIASGRHEAGISAREVVYFRMLMPGGGFIFVSAAFSAFFSGRGRTWTVAIINIAASLTNILLDYMFIFGHFGAPAMGIAGAGFATTLSCGVGALTAFTFFVFQNQERYPTRKNRSLNWDDLKRLLSFGAPSGIQVLFSVGAFTYMIFLIGQIGSSELAATTIALSINMINFMPLMGISDAAGILTGRYIGKGRSDISEQAAYRAWKTASGYMLVTGMLYILFPDAIIYFFAPENNSAGIDFANVVKTGRIILLCAACYNLFNAARFVFIGALRGAGDTKVPMWIIIACSWGILAPGGYILVIVMHASILAVWLFMTFIVGIVSLLIVLRFRSGKWKHIKMTKDIPPVPDAVTEVLEAEAETPHI